MYSIEDLEKMAVSELRTIARLEAEKHKIKKTVINFLQKDDLVKFIINPLEYNQEAINPAPVNNNNNDNLADIIANALQGKITANIDETRVKELIAESIDILEELLTEKIDSMKTTSDIKIIEVKNISTNESKIVGKQHYLYPKILKIVNSGANIWLVGAAGSGKTHTCQKIAEALNLDFYPQSVNGQTTISALMGYNAANGNYISSPFRQAFENGGLYLLDEVDAGNGNVLLALNAASSNDFCLFPDGKLVKRHEKFRLIACANTYGKGNNREYSGRNVIDGALIDRFVFLDFPYDEKLEMDLCGNKEWCMIVRNIRKVISNMPDVRHIVSPRASFAGASLILDGFGVEDVKKMVIYKGLNIEVVRRIEAAIKVSE